jgi:DNA-directed RNA polymerase subunit RPC12/RpoP
MELLIIGILLLFGIIVLARRSEKKAYNNGICNECGTELHHFDNDSQGGRGYVCDNCCYTVWVSYPWVDN